MEWGAEKYRIKGWGMTSGSETGSFVLNCVPSKNRDRIWSHEAALQADVVRRISGSDLPPICDLRHPDLWPVRHQGETSACVGFATADGLLRYHYAQRGLTRSLEVMPSPRFIWMADKESDDDTDYPTTFIEGEGAQVCNGLGVAQRWGCVMEEDLPMSGQLWKGTTQAFYVKAARFRIAAYHSLGRDLNVWRKWLVSNGPILARLEVDAAWNNATATGGRLDQFQPETCDGGHAVCIVGYTPNGFIVRNSWGPDWGDQGFAYASIDYAAAAFADNGGEVYGAVF